jgi:hypothetical protein
MTADRERLLDRAQAIHDRAKSEGRALTDSDRQTIEALLASVRMDDEITTLGKQLGLPGSESGGSSFYNAVMAAGFDRRTNPAIQLPFGAVASFDGDYGTAIRVDQPAPGLGADTRFLYPLLPRIDVESDTTSIASFRQKSRTLADPDDMIRDIVAVSTKPETDTETELVTEELKQIATVESGVPNIMLENAAFRDWIGFDLRLAYASAIDAHVIGEIEAAAPPFITGTSGALLEELAEAAESVSAAGYAPSVVAGTPLYLRALMFTLQPSGDNYVFSGNQIPDLGLRRVAVPGMPNPIVMDPAAAGVLYASPVSLRTFEENAGKTNTSTVRIESNGLFVVQRLDAIAMLDQSS